jgi:hypothetical protein
MTLEFIYRFLTLCVSRNLNTIGISFFEKKLAFESFFMNLRACSFVKYFTC